MYNKDIYIHRIAQSILVISAVRQRQFLGFSHFGHSPCQIPDSLSSRLVGNYFWHLSGACKTLADHKSVAGRDLRMRNPGKCTRWVSAKNALTQMSYCPFTVPPPPPDPSTRQTEDKCRRKNRTWINYKLKALESAYKSALISQYAKCQKCQNIPQSTIKYLWSWVHFLNNYYYSNTKLTECERKNQTIGQLMGFLSVCSGINWKAFCLFLFVFVWPTFRLGLGVIN